MTPCWRYTRGHFEGKRVGTPFTLLKYLRTHMNGIANHDTCQVGRLVRRPGGPARLPARWASTSNVEAGSGMGKRTQRLLAKETFVQV